MKTLEIKKIGFVLFFLTIFTFTGFSQSNNCSGNPEDLDVEASCDFEDFEVKQDGEDKEEINASCATGTGYSDAWYEVTGNGSDITISVEDPNRNMCLAVFDACASGEIDCIMISSGNDGSITFSSVNGESYFVQIQRRSGNNDNNLDGEICAFSAPPAPANDACADAITLPCATVDMDGTTEGTGNVAHGTGCSMSNYGVWYTFVGDGQETEISVDASGSFNHEISVTSGACGSLTNVDCVNEEGGGDTEEVSFIATLGTTYYIYIADKDNGDDDVGDFEISRTCIAPPTPPENDECETAIGLTVNAATTCTSETAGTIEGATQSADADACGGDPDDDVWFSFVATSTEHDIEINNVTGGEDLRHDVFAGTCVSVGVALVCSDPNESTVSGLTIGNTYYIRVYSEDSDASTSDFNMCVLTPPVVGACGNELTNDYCDAPALLTKGAGNFSSSTYDYYTEDDPSNLEAEFCGQLDNNSYYEFIASATEEVFNFTSVTNCTDGDGIQAEVFEVTTNASGCCTDFESVSNCWNPGNPEPGVVTATGLTVGNRYILMVDGWAGDHCDFVVQGWSAIGILLPIELLSYSAETIGNEVEINFTTATERDVDYFVVENSRDGSYWQQVATIEAVGNSTDANSYKATDKNPNIGTSYYRIKDVSVDGKGHYSAVFSNDFSSSKYLLYPIPVNSSMFLEGNDIVNSEITLVNNIGNIIPIDYTFFGEKASFDFSGIKNGMYYLVIQSASNKRTERVVVVHK